MRLLLFFLLYFFLVPSSYAYNIAVGSYTGDAGASHVVPFSTSCIAGTNTCSAFAIDVLLIRCNHASSGRHIVWTSSSMTAGHALYLTTTTGDATGIITSIGTGTFTVPNNVYSNDSGVTCYYLALGKDAHNDLAVGSYTGNTSGQTLTITPTFTPDAFITQDANGASNAAQFWVAGKGGDSTASMLYGTSAANYAGGVTGVGSGTVTLGTNAKVDAAHTFQYFAIGNPTGEKSGVYAGTGAGHDIPASAWTPASTPIAIFIKETDSTQGLAHRWGLGTNLSWIVSTAAIDYAITAFKSGQFTVGTSSVVNANTQNFQYLALGIPSYARRRATFIQ